MIAYKYSPEMKPRPNIAWREMRKTAVDYHKEMYTALAEHDLPTLKRICCEGLYNDMKQRISDQRQRQASSSSSSPSPPPYRWTRHKVSLPRIMCTRASTFPILRNSVFRQHVVRIRSVQSLDPLVVRQKQTPNENEDMNENENENESGENESEEKVEYEPGEKVAMTEYFVLQRRIMKGVEEGWKMWGTVQETEASTVLGEREGKKRADKAFIDVAKA